MTRRGLIFTASAALAQAQKPTTPSLKVSLPAGKSLLTSQLAGGPALVSIFKTNCPHCQKSLPIIQKVFRDFSAKGLKAVGVAVDQNPEPLVLEFAKSYGVTFPLGWAPIDDICKFLDVRVEQLYVPALVVFNRAGKLHARYPAGDAFFNMEEANLRNLVELLVQNSKKA